ncbi:MAG: hypothetical protein BAJATHORv1_20225 [Candidatus Thorarchaeota archaeon]|nr:MAG: hypothetical protein BAJATHORv1_20225 [Candidatus Thorarchaeota archaeon]
MYADKFRILTGRDNWNRIDFSNQLALFIKVWKRKLSFRLD